MEITARRSEEKTLEETIKTIEVQDNTDIVENRQVGEENYVIGCGLKANVSVFSSTVRRP